MLTYSPSRCVAEFRNKRHARDVLLSKSPTHKPMSKPPSNPFKRRRGQPAWASSKVIQRHARFRKLAPLSKQELRTLAAKCDKPA
jgi:hypothetical protein